MSKKHAPTPWRVAVRDSEDHRFCHRTGEPITPGVFLDVRHSGEDCRSVFSCYASAERREEVTEVYELIVRAVNAHEELIAQLADTMALAHAAMKAANRDGASYDIERELAGAETLLAKAKGGAS